MTDAIPGQQEGAESNTESTKELASVGEAKDFFREVRDRLLDVNNWQKLAGAATAVFRLTDLDGNEVDRTAKEGDHFKIDIPGPGPSTGDGFDWVKVEKIEETHDDDIDRITIRVRPATNPNNSRQDVAHFFADNATSSFVVERKNKKVTAAVYGRNEKPNTDAEKITDKARNIAVATGAITGASKLQWKSLVNGLIG